jgi:hypothetical protein
MIATNNGDFNGRMQHLNNDYILPHVPVQLTLAPADVLKDCDFTINQNSPRTIFRILGEYYFYLNNFVMLHI